MDFHYLGEFYEEWRIFFDSTKNCYTIENWRDQGIRRAEYFHERMQLKIQVIQLFVMSNFYLEIILKNMSS